MQGAQAQAELQSLGADVVGPVKTLSARVQRALREHSQQWSGAVQRSSAMIGHALNGTMHGAAAGCPKRLAAFTASQHDAAMSHSRGCLLPCQ